MARPDETESLTDYPQDATGISLPLRRWGHLGQVVRCADVK
jgi:hypothetical protein